ncbi:hypothetical protein ARMSODRAFT_163947 [Armillaria solidipes]|uniref:Uncharacterized protein n=1 Tax=Armillaria solidipes TaxID=1076256 RepID=A0A2H3BTU9_9AGAR|nr:hypothetical protein ARMSODRAFT_163947 [Armillaria solidipes]
MANESSWNTRRLTFCVKNLSWSIQVTTALHLTRCAFVSICCVEATCATERHPIATETWISDISTISFLQTSTSSTPLHMADITTQNFQSLDLIRHTVYEETSPHPAIPPHLSRPPQWRRQPSPRSPFRSSPLSPHWKPLARASSEDCFERLEEILSLSRFRERTRTFPANRAPSVGLGQN